MRKRKIKTIIKEVHEDGVIAFDTPALIKLLEYVHESVKTDEDIHTLTQKLLEISDDGSTLKTKHVLEVVAP